ncbi:3-hydroxyacyl-CoA dehydrogenase NAD-binding domain-containing protein [Adhaeribacter radiodurans]|uniref:3-hydroxybutyryl-CoA dehydrogenase n=1 Tax=Adhaeribacter radiodurans TaxID=2745197 RepID=A0A7L7LD92_9BACT|nr:3-hydroxyacyl-CoA dehydrogenase NAD-binding domain-containing protein [Adhaeribacter radiodurans]QMU30495.1 3-hydroxybutyryl-CoA dehydrogenase [Adhaeribacter radiodurans]
MDHDLSTIDYNIKTIGVVGAGTMGQGIAQVCAQAGCPTILYDINPAVLSQARRATEQNWQRAVEKGKLTPRQKIEAEKLIVFTSDIQQVIADLIIEAVIEKLEVKQNLLTELAAFNEPSTILTSNTSSLPITSIAAKIPHPERVVGMHFFNPAPVMPLVEIVAGLGTDPKVTDAVYAMAQQLGKSPVRVQDSPGFIVNRVARPFYTESLKMLEENVADVATIDALLRATGFKMGPFELMDLIGVDVNFAVTSALYDAFYHDPKFRPSRIQKQKVDAGYHGRKSGKGFYDYS